MSLIKSVFTISLQLNPKLTLKDGITTYVELLTDDQAAGIICMASSIFEGNIDQHLVLAINNVENGELIQYSSSVYLDEYLVTSVPFFIPFDTNLYTWSEYIFLVASYSKTRRIPAEIARTYSCRIKTPFSTNIFQFETSGFIEGAIKLCTWLKFDHKKLIDNVHIGNTKFSIFPV